MPVLCCAEWNITVPPEDGRHCKQCHLAAHLAKAREENDKLRALLFRARRYTLSGTTLEAEIADALGER